ncbi:MAG: hypothetical protein Ct9H300mP9_3060 [Candidatus Neomarinimicrobiota bacterium]|nr:MAG: hypothetical protein Ct9H300mP9_3060 [Candidatus Neomarinimicrobiota bacterium]
MFAGRYYYRSAWEISLELGLDLGLWVEIWEDTLKIFGRHLLPYSRDEYHLVTYAQN